MGRIKGFFRRVFNLPVGWSLVAAFCGFWLLGFALTHDTPPVLDHMAYHLSAYGLVVLVTAVLRVVPAIREWVEGIGWVERVRYSPQGVQFREDPAYRAQAILYISMAWNVFYALVKLAAGIILDSLWLRSLGVYYLLLGWLRLTLVARLPRRDIENEGWRRYRACGVSLLMMNLALVAMVILLLTQKGVFHYPGPLIYLMAGYTFWAIISATVNLAVSHRRSDPLQSAARSISLTAAMVSVLALETALMDRFGDDALFYRLMVATTGGGVCLGELYMACYMIGRAGRMIGESVNGREQGTGNREQE